MFNVLTHMFCLCLCCSFTKFFRKKNTYRSDVSRFLTSELLLSCLTSVIQQFNNAKQNSKKITKAVWNKLRRHYCSMSLRSGTKYQADGSLLLTQQSKENIPSAQQDDAQLRVSRSSRASKMSSASSSAVRACAKAEAACVQLQ